MTNIKFYDLNEDTNEFLYKFVKKIYSTDKKVLIHFDNKEEMVILDTFLWTHKKIDFLPHLLSDDENADITPIILTDKMENKNNADVIIVNSFVNNKEFLNKFEKIYYIISFDKIEKGRQDYKNYKSKEYHLTVLKKNENAEWIES
ncbi:MAG: DNA polymerase III subunit chi [Rickettsiales bacterium]|jgi:DNA polymerase IIIc chi subunit|nr:DNA polymerase III subunit chi [Rickettsiales bacterium]